MNNGKICVSVCAKTADELIEQIKRAEDLADVIEIRFDCLDEGEFDNFLYQFRTRNPSKQYLSTFRPAKQGGKKYFTFEEREQFWLDSHIFEFTDWADLEEDISIEKLRGMWGINVFEKFIKSNHDFEKSPDDLFEIYERLNSTKADVIKIAVQANDITNTIPISKLLNRAKSENKEIIPIAMGESGKWTRILGLAHGAFMTYASLDAGSETAPGQVSTEDLIEVYRAKELNEETEVYGILGSSTSVSMSPYIHNAAFKFHKLNSVFVPLQVQNLDEFITRMVKPETREVELNFKGFSVTIPHKQSIIKHLDFIDETAKMIGAVNTVKIIDGKLHGYNTDAKGFIEPLLKASGDLNDARVLILGAGGASRACVYSLENEGAEVTVFGRSEVQNLTSKVQSLSDFDIIVNATPIGMKGKGEGETPLFAEQMKGVKLVYDLIYIPQETELIKQAKSVGIKTLGGLEMLLSQAIEQQRIWTGLDAPIDEIKEVVLKKLSV